MRRIVLNADSGFMGHIRAAFAYLATGTPLVGSTLVSDTGSGKWSSATDYTSWNSSLDVRIQQFRLGLVNGESVFGSIGVTADWTSGLMLMRVAQGYATQFDPRQSVNYPNGYEVGIHAGNIGGAGTVTVLATAHCVKIISGTNHFTLVLTSLVDNGDPGMRTIYSLRIPNGTTTSWQANDCAAGATAPSVRTGAHMFPAFSSLGYGRAGAVVHPSAKLRTLNAGRWQTMDDELVHSYLAGVAGDTLTLNGVVYSSAGDGLWLKS